MDPIEEPGAVGIDKHGDAVLQTPGGTMLSCPLEIAHEVRLLRLIPHPGTESCVDEPVMPLAAMGDGAVVYGSARQGWMHVPMSLYETP